VTTSGVSVDIINSSYTTTYICYPEWLPMYQLMGD
jgi:hypothetical protein